ncbi:MAG: sialidase family protein, partial [Saprospiraceae bacterium]
IVVYKLNTGSGQVEMYSHLQINTNLRKEDIHITEAGDILFAINNQLLLADHRTPDIFEEVKLDSALNILKVEQIGRIANGQIFVLTDKGIYINSNLGLNHWTKLINLSLNIPSKIDKIVIHDTLNAILTVTDECDYTEAYFFIPSTLDWKLVNLNIDVNTFESLTKDNNNILYAYHNCYFKYSEDDGVNWNFLSINGEPVEQITTNKNGDAVAAVNQKIFILDKFSGLWKIANNTIFKIPNLKLKYFIKSGSELFIEGALGDFDSPNAKYFLFHSSDGGMNWSKINAFRKSAYYNYSGLSISVLENNTWIGHGDIVDTIVSSNDLGLTWNIDPLFENFSRARNIIQLPDNRKIICGRYKKKYGAYISSTSNEYELMNSYFENKIFDIYYIGPNFIFGNASYNDGVFFSTDLGKNITIDESGMAPNTFDQRYYYGLLYDEEQKIYVSLGFDGLYKATKNIFTSSKDLRPLMHSKFLKVNFDQSELQITMVDENVDFRSIKFEILNQLGQLIKQGKFEYKSNSINIQQALSGIYYFKVIYPNQSSEAIKFIKY